jgi:hypothetical protein
LEDRDGGEDDHPVRPYRGSDAAERSGRRGRLALPDRLFDLQMLRISADLVIGIGQVDDAVLDPDPGLPGPRAEDSSASES